MHVCCRNFLGTCFSFPRTLGPQSLAVCSRVLPWLFSACVLGSHSLLFFFSFHDLSIVHSSRSSQNELSTASCSHAPFSHWCCFFAWSLPPSRSLLSTPSVLVIPQRLLGSFVPQSDWLLFIDHPEQDLVCQSVGPSTCSLSCPRSVCGFPPPLPPAVLLVKLLSALLNFPLPIAFSSDNCTSTVSKHAAVPALDVAHAF